MTEQGISKVTSGFGLSLIIMLFLNAVLVVIKETYSPLLKWMAALTGHHWITHGIFIMGLFFILGIIFSLVQPAEKPWLDAKGVIIGLIVSMVIAFVMIAGFYLVAE